MSQTEPRTTAKEATCTLDEVKKLRVDALYGKKKHFNAADRKRRYHLWTGIPALIINLLLGSYLVGALSSVLPDLCNWVGAAFALIAAALIALQTALNFERTAELHQSIGTRYLSVAKECGRLIAYCKDDKVEASSLREQLENLARRHDEINCDAAKCPTSDADYRKAKQGFKEGEEEYTEGEFNAKD